MDMDCYKEKGPLGGSISRFGISTRQKGNKKILPKSTILITTPLLTPPILSPPTPHHPQPTHPPLLLLQSFRPHSSYPVHTVQITTNNNNNNNPHNTRHTHPAQSHPSLNPTQLPKQNQKKWQPTRRNIFSKLSSLVTQGMLIHPPPYLLNISPCDV